MPSTRLSPNLTSPHKPWISTQISSTLFTSLSIRVSSPIPPQPHYPQNPSYPPCQHLLYLRRVLTPSSIKRSNMIFSPMINRSRRSLALRTSAWQDLRRLTVPLRSVTTPTCCSIRASPLRPILTNPRSASTIPSTRTLRAASPTCSEIPHLSPQLHLPLLHLPLRSSARRMSVLLHPLLTATTLLAERVKWRTRSLRVARRTVLSVCPLSPILTSNPHRRGRAKRVVELDLRFPFLCLD